MDLISILIPVYNREKFIKETVSCAQNQTYENIEIVIVDNQSTDNTWTILKDMAKNDLRIKLFQNRENIGPVRNWKRCIDEAKGKYGKILWSDDLIAHDFLEKTIHFFIDHDDIGFVFVGTEIFTDGNTYKTDAYFIGKSGIYDSEKFIKGLLFGTNYPVSPGCALFRLNDLKNNLLIDIPNKIGSDFSQHAIGNDLLIFLFTAHQYPKFAFVNEKLSFFRGHDESISISSTQRELILYYDIVKAHFVENFRPDLIPKINGVIWLHLVWLEFRGNQDTLLLNVKSLKDFYMNNCNFRISWTCLLFYIIHKIFRSRVC